MEKLDFSQIHHRGFELSLLDLRMLRGMYRKINPDVTYASLNRLPRQFLIDKILIDEYSAKIMAKYREHCDMLDNFEKISLEIEGINHDESEEMEVDW